MLLRFRILAHFFARYAGKKTGLSAPIFWLRQKDFRYNPSRPTGFSRFRATDKKLRSA
jgi:hypothetical protein